MTTASITVQRVTCYLPPWLIAELDAEVGYAGVSRTDVIRRWLERVVNSKNKKSS